MTELQALFAAIAAVVLFLHGLQGFSHELRTAGGAALQVWLERVTTNRFGGFALGVMATAIVQSSSAVTSLTTALVDAGVISFRASLGVLLGSNVGTTATAWLVSFKLTGIGPVFIVLGAVLSALPRRYGFAGKAVFYFGLIFLALDLISAELKPLQNHPLFRDWLALAVSPWLGIVTGILFTALIQSSSVTTGVAILLVQQGALPPEAAIPVVIGANVGSTSTALIASIGLSAAARATATANLIFNTVAMLAFLPFLTPFARMVLQTAGEPGMAVALAHLIFNLAMAVVMLCLLDPVESRLRVWLHRESDKAGGDRTHHTQKGSAT